MCQLYLLPILTASELYDIIRKLFNILLAVALRTPANAELSLRLPAPGSRFATLRANQSLEPTVMDLHTSFACGKSTPAAQLRVRWQMRDSRAFTRFGG